MAQTLMHMKFDIAMKSSLSTVPPRRILPTTRTMATQTSPLAHDPAMVMQIKSLEEGAAHLGEQLEQEEARTCAADQALKLGQVDAAAQLAVAKAAGAAELAVAHDAATAQLAVANEATAAALGAVDRERLTAGQRAKDHQQQLLKADAEAVKLCQSMEDVKSRLASTCLDLKLLEQRHRKTVEEKLEQRELAAKLQFRLDQEVASRNSQAAAARSMRPKRSSLSHAGSCTNRDGVDVSLEPRSVMEAQLGSSTGVSSDDDGSSRRSSESSRSSSQAGETLCSLDA